MVRFLEIKYRIDKQGHFITLKGDLKVVLNGFIEIMLTKYNAKIIINGYNKKSKSFADKIKDILFKDVLKIYIKDGNLIIEGV